MLIQNTDSMVADAFELGVNHVIVNIPFHHILGQGIDYTYDGKSYSFSREVLENLDYTIRRMSEKSMTVTAVILNGWNDSTPQLVYPGVTKQPADQVFYYGFNASTKEGYETIKAIASFLAERYSSLSSPYGKVSNWIIGNEVNARTSWWYTNSASLDLNVNTYVKTFRIFYNELKSMNANVRVYNSLDQEWNRKSNPGSFLSRDYLDQFNYYMNREGNIDWGLSFHPYNSPLYDPYAWNGPAVWVKDSVSSLYITMQNIDVLVDYMHQPQFLNPQGEVRSISLAEVGYTSSFGTQAQEASVAYGYLKAASLPDVDAFMLFRQTDEAYEMESHLALGLYDLDGNKKPAYEIYKNLGTANEAAAKARASEIIGMDIDEMIGQKILWTRSGTGVVQ